MKADVTKKLKGWMTVKELRDELDGFPDNAVVVFKHGYGDRGNTQQALRINSVEELATGYEDLARTAYSDSGICIEEIDLDDEPDGRDEQNDDPNAPDVVVLS